MMKNPVIERYPGFFMNVFDIFEEKSSMLVILSPAKDMKVVPSKNILGLMPTIPEFVDKAENLISVLRKMEPYRLSDTLKISNKLTELNFKRFQSWDKKHVPNNSSPSIISFTGEAYRGLNANDFSIEDLEYSQKVLRIISGLYGVLRPLDLLQAYRLEMGSGICIDSFKNLYEFWREEINEIINEAIEESPGEKLLINLASFEYYSTIDFKSLNYNVITPLFKDEKSGELKTITVYAKRARGLMTRFIIKNRLENSEDLKAFTDEGYYFENELSQGNNWLFVR
jgi:cytoplasmic iron level regulating protein YaaA (DUF328/UPF0246 family)